MGFNSAFKGLSRGFGKKKTDGEVWFYGSHIAEAAKNEGTHYKDIISGVNSMKTLSLIS